MKKKILMLASTGNKHSLYIDIDKSTLAKLKVDENTKFEFSVSKNAMKIVPIKKKKTVPKTKTKKNVQAIAKKVMKTHEEVLKKLAKT